MNTVIYIIPNHLYDLVEQNSVVYQRDSKIEKLIKKRLKSYKKHYKEGKRISQERSWFGITFGEI